MWRGEEKDDTFDTICHSLDIQQIDDSSMIIEFISLIKAEDRVKKFAVVVSQCHFLYRGILPNPVVLAGKILGKF